MLADAGLDGAHVVAGQEVAVGLLNATAGTGARDVGFFLGQFDRSPNYLLVTALTSTDN